MKIIITKGTNRVLRGGSWYDDALFSRVAFSGGYSPVIRSYDDGFRITRRIR